jgi:rhamnose utilization protein RhaD (predicted bifunctional aldolase and dehydrogenase)
MSSKGYIYPGCYGVRFYEWSGATYASATDCTSALRTQNALVMLVVDSRNIVVVEETAEGGFLRRFSSIKEALEYIKRNYGDDVAKLLIEQAKY